MQILGII